MSDADAVLSVTGLRKRFGRREAVADVSFALGPGEIVGFLGPNGAGKTTTIRMLVGLIRPDAGSIRIKGIDVTKNAPAALRHVGCIVEAPDLYDFLSGRENLEHFARMIDRAALLRVDEVAELLRMQHRLDDRVGTYSLGMRQRLGIAQALLGRPALLILDEPANGLDPAGIRELREQIRGFAERGIAVLVSSHHLAEIEQVCDRIVILHRGRTLASGPLAELTQGGRRSLEDLFLDATGGQSVD